MTYSLLRANSSEYLPRIPTTTSYRLSNEAPVGSGRSTHGRAIAVTVRRPVPAAPATRRLATRGRRGKRTQFE
jgi:hypothetical protein